MYYMLKKIELLTYLICQIDLLKLFISFQYYYMDITYNSDKVISSDYQSIVPTAITDYNNLMVHSKDVIHILNISMETDPEENFYQKFKKGDNITGTQKTYIVLRHLSKNVVLCSDKDGYVYVIKFDILSNLSFYKETRLNILLNKGCVKIISNNSIIISGGSAINPNRSESQIPKTNSSLNENTTKWTFRKLFCCIYDSNPDLNPDLNPNYKKIYNPIIDKYVYYGSNTDKCELMINPFEQNKQIDPKYLIINNDAFDSNMIPDVIETFKIDNNGYQVSRFCGIDLFIYISMIIKEKMRLDESLCKKIFYQIVQIIYKLHKLGIAHGDLSLENFCIDSSVESDIPVIKIIDFGFAGIHPLSQIINIYNECKYNKDLYNQTDRFNICENISFDTMYCSLVPYNSHYGKLYYVSPERSHANNYLGKKYCMFKDDIYSLGIILFMMISGISPYLHSDQDIIPHHTIPYEKWLITNVSAECVNLLRKMICYEKSRINIDELIADPWLKNQ